MASKPIQTQATAAPLPSFSTFRPTLNDFFRIKHARGAPLWVVEVTRVRDGKVEFVHEMDPPDTLDAITRRVAGLVQEAERRS